MKNLGNLMKQAQEMQAKMQEMQDRLAEIEIDGTAGAGLVTVTLNGKGRGWRPERPIILIRYLKVQLF